MKVYAVHDPYNFVVGVYSKKSLAVKARDFLGAGHYVTAYEVKESIETTNN